MIGSPRPMPRALRIGGLALAAFALVGGGLLVFGQDEAPVATSIQLASAKRGTVTAAVTASGNTVDSGHRDLSFASDGKVSKVYVTIGQKVKKGQILARIDDTQARETYTAAHAGVLAAAESLDKAKNGETTTGSQQSGSNCTTTPQKSAAPARSAAPSRSASPSAQPSAQPSEKPSAQPSEKPSAPPSSRQPSPRPSQTSTKPSGTPSVVSSTTVTKHAETSSPTPISTAVETEKGEPSPVSTTTTTPDANDPSPTVTVTVVVERTVVVHELVTVRETVTRGVLTTIIKTLTGPTSTDVSFPSPSASAMPATSLKPTASAKPSASAKPKPSASPKPTTSPKPQASANPKATTNASPAAQARTCGSSGGSRVSQAVSDAMIRQAEANYNAAKSTFSDAKDALAGVVIKAPKKGTILAVNGEKGDSASAGVTFITESDLAELQVDAKFTESDIGKLKAGQKATITMDSRPGQTFDGEVSQIDTAPTTTNSLVQYGVRIAFDKPPAGLLLGQTVSVQVTTGEAADALYVPESAVRTAPDGTYTVTVRNGGTDIRRTVKIGVHGDQYVEIVDGLAEGDQVVVQNNDSTTGGFPNGTFPS